MCEAFTVHRHLEIFPVQFLCRSAFSKLNFFIIFSCCAGYTNITAANFYIPFSFSFLNTVSKVANCFLDIIIIELFDIGRDAKKTLGFEHISSKI